MSGQQVIDVDAPIIVDLTQVISIDLTEDDNIKQYTPSHHGKKSPSRTKVVYTPKNTNSLQTNQFPPIPNSAPSTQASPVSYTHPILNDRATKRHKKDVAPTVIDVDDVPTQLIPPVTAGDKRGIIELDSDGEDVVVKHKKLKFEGRPTSDEEDVYERCHAGYDLNNEELWKPVNVNKAKISFDMAEGIQGLAISNPPVVHCHIPRPDISRPLLSTNHPKWNFPTNRVHYRHPRPIKSFQPTQLHNVSRRNPVQPLKLLTSFKAAAGAITQIEQCGSWVAISSGTVGGQPDQPNDEHNPYNKEGTIMVWDNAVHVLPGHSRERGEEVKHYTVHDLKFDPCSSSIVSSGNDKSVHVWTLDDDTNSFFLSSVWRYQNVPHDLAFKPGESILAVAERMLMIYSDISPEASFSQLSLSGSKRHKYIIGAIAWGHGPTASYLFASSEPKDNILFGYHGAFDATVNRLVYHFDEDGAGDAITVTEDGERLALLTRCEERRHSLQIYDVRRATPKTVLNVELDPFPQDLEGEVTSAAFSPDGIYIALGRNDNHTHVYDSRKLDRVIFDYEHHGQCRTNPGAQSYGVVGVRWVEKDSLTPMGLITGGNDGCVRFWDPLRAVDSANNGIVLGEMNSDIAHFSVGDRTQGQRPLIIGDCAGEISVFDIQASYFQYMYR